MKAETKMENREARRRIAERDVTSARLVLLWERVWLAMWPGIGIVGIGMIIALSAAFVVAFPVNRYLIDRGKGHALTMQHHPDHQHDHH